MTTMSTDESMPFSGRLFFPALHPGELVLRQCLEPLGLSVAAGAKALGVTRAALYNIIRAKSGISPEMAVRLSQVFGSSAEMWLRLQAAYDLEAVQRRDHIHLAKWVAKEGTA